jgi:hypothetical protein
MNGKATQRWRLGLVGGAAAASLASAFAATALAAGSFSDPAGDNTGALDIASATVSEPAPGRLKVTVAIANAQTLPVGSRIDVWFDLDNDLRTGAEGDEALARYLANGTLNFSRSRDDDLVRRPTTGMTASFDSGVLTYEGPKSAFDDVSSFGLLVVTRGVQDLEDDEVAAFDALPGLARAQYVAPGPVTFADPEGDVPVAPDLRSVRVSDAKDGTIRFTVATSDASLVPGKTIRLAIDRDLVGGDSPVDRAEVLLSFADGELSLARWDADEEEWVDDAAPTRARAGVAGKAVVFEVHRSELEDVARFGFAVEAWAEDEDEDVAALDAAPDELDSVYTLAHRPPLRLIGGEVFGTPSRPVAGHHFTINLPVTRSDTARGLTSGKVACDVRADGSKVRATGSIAKGVARCELVVPRASSVVRGSMTVRSAGKSITAWFAGAIDFGGGVEPRTESR